VRHRAWRSTHILKVTSPCVLRLRAPNYFLDITRNVNASSGAVEMTAPPLVSVQLRSRYQNCTLYVDGKAVGSPPADLEMAVGTLRATIRCPERRDLRIEHVSHRRWPHQPEDR
jgi:hypothetical protein